MTLQWTGERYIPGLVGPIELEHLHRYRVAAAAAAGLDVLDIASGEGYGSFLLASVARTVIGVDISADAVAHAQARYVAPNLTYRVGACSNIPVAGGSVDLIVSFETIEHHLEHEEMMREFVRVLRPNGTVLISSPDKAEYSDQRGIENEFHVKELYRDEFTRLLQKYFRHIELHGQRVVTGSVLSPLDVRTDRFQHFGNLEISNEPFNHLDRPMYFIAVASNAKVRPLPISLFENSRHGFPATGDFEIRLYWAGDDEFAEARSVSAFTDVGAHERTVTLLMPDQADRVQRLRLDLGDYPSMVRLIDMRVLSGAGDAFWTWDGKPEPFVNTSQLVAAVQCDQAQHEVVFYALGNDPHVELCLPAVTMDHVRGGCTIELKLSIHSLQEGFPSLVSLLTTKQSTEPAVGARETARQLKECELELIALRGRERALTTNLQRAEAQIELLKRLFNA